MASRSVRRRHNKRCKRLESLSPVERDAKAVALLLAWRQEAYRRAKTLSAAAVWALANDPRLRTIAASLDPSGELQAELNRVCAEAVSGKGVGRAAKAVIVPGGLPTAEPSSALGKSPDHRPVVIRPRRQ